MGDFDQDGDVDFYTNNGGPKGIASSSELNAFFINEGNDYAWTQVRLVGVVSNRSAVGAHLTGVTNEARKIHRWLRAGHGFCNTNSPVQHFGIGEDSHLSKIVIEWPSGIFQLLNLPEMSTIIDVTEFGLALTKDPDANGSFNVAVAGLANHEVEILLNGQPFATRQLDARGGGRFELQRPFISELVESGGLLTAWIYPVGKPSEGVSTEPIEIQFQP
jgi:hypothetical protein